MPSLSAADIAEAEQNEERRLVVVDIEALDDEALFKLLKENGVDAGPVVDSTRSLYKKKLAQVLR